VPFWPEISIFAGYSKEFNELTKDQENTSVGVNFSYDINDYE